MESTEKDILIEKVRKMPPEQVNKVMIFIAGLEAAKIGGTEEEKSHQDAIQ